MNDEEVVDLLVSIFRADKMPEYPYWGDGRDNAFGQAPPDGERWLTPRELVKQAWKKLGLGEQELYDKARMK